MSRIYSFAPVFDSKSRVLVLGSMASIKSLEAGFFYMHPQNRFWKVLSALTSEDFYGAETAEKTKLLLKHGIALCDILESCVRKGSMDGDIKDASARDLTPIIQGSEVRALFCNGRKSFDETFKRWNGKTVADRKFDTGNIFYLPSTSPANAAHFDFEKWRVLLDYIL